MISKHLPAMAEPQQPDILAVVASSVSIVSHSEGEQVDTLKISDLTSLSIDNLSSPLPGLGSFFLEYLLLPPHCLGLSPRPFMSSPIL